MVADTVIRYNAIHDLDRYETAVEMGKMEKCEGLVKDVEHTHIADDDALFIASKYAAYALKYPSVA